MSEISTTGHIHKLINDNLNFKEFISHYISTTYFYDCDDYKNVTLDNTYYQRQCDELKINIDNLTKMTASERLEYGTDIIKTKTAEYTKCIAAHKNELNKVAQTLKAAVSWFPSNPTLLEAKNQIIHDLNLTLSSNETSYYTNKLQDLLHTTPLEQYELELYKLKKDLESYMESRDKQKANNDITAKFIQDIDESLNKL